MEYTQLANICSFQSGGTPSKGVQDYYGGSIPWITTVALNDGQIGSQDAVAWITEKAIQHSAAKIIPAHSIMVGTRVGIGKVAINTIDMATNQDIISLISIDETAWDKRYLCKFIQARREQLKEQARGATIKGIKIETLASLKVPTIPIAEQLDIVRQLDTIQQVLVLQHQQLTKLDKLIKARFVEMFNTCKNEVAIGDVITICRGASPRPIVEYITDDPKGINWIKIGDVLENSLYITHAAERITPEGASKSRPVKKGDFILSNSMSFGRPYILGIDGCVHDGWLILSDFHDTFHELYLYHALKSEFVQHQFKSKVNGVTVKNLNSDLVKSTYIKLPEKVKQNQFAVFVTEVDKSKAVLYRTFVIVGKVRCHHDQF